MKCPVCLATMECRSAIKEKVYMDLHCFNDECASKEINYRPHVGVVLSLLGRAPWRCISYHLPFKEKAGYRDSDTWYVLEGNNNETILHERNFFVMSDKLMFDEGKSSMPGFLTKKDNLKIWEMEPIISINKFMPLITNDDMHIAAQKIFEEIKKIEIFTDYSYDDSSCKTGYYGDYD